MNGAFAKIPSSCAINSGIDFSDIANVRCENVVGDASTKLRVHGFKEVNAEFLMWISILMTNPND